MELSAHTSLAHTLQMALENKAFGNPQCEGAARILAHGLDDIVEKMVGLSNQLLKTNRHEIASDPQMPPFQRLVALFTDATPESQNRIIELLEQEHLKPSENAE